jgi:hypothetical protein
MDIQPKCRATAIGSLPHVDVEKALDVVFDTMDAPIWPQLPKLGLREQMEIQYSQGLPRVVLDEEHGRMFIDTSGDYSEDLATFYEAYMKAEETGDCSAMAITPEYSAGIYAMEARLKKMGKRLPLFKCQTTGPISFALTIVDENKRAIYYNEEFVDTVVKGLAMKCRWQIQKFKPYADNIICFIDEPILSAFGSSTYVSVQREDVVGKLAEVVEAIHGEEAIAGIHCCGNTDWSILVDAGIDILNFDAYEFGKTVALYPEHMRKQVVERSNSLAWGIVPTSTAVRNETVEKLVEKFVDVTEHLAKQTGIAIQTIVQQSFLCPSCGTGSMEVADAEKVFALLRDTSRALRKRYGFAS